MTAAVGRQDQPRYILFLLLLAYMSSYIDRIALGIFGEAIKRDLSISDTELGVLTGFVFVIFYSVLGVPIGRLADRFPRRKLLTACLCLWSAMTILAGSATTFGTLLLTRIGVGIGEAGLTPSAHSLLSDLYPRQRRSFAFAVFGAGPPLGIIVGALAGGWIAQALGWRIGMVAIGLPGIVIGLLFLLTVHEPQRGQQDDEPVADALPSFGAAVRTVARDPLFVLVTLGMACAAVSLYSLSTFTVPHLIRRYEMDLFTAASLFGVSYGTAGVLGAVLGGVLTDWAGTRNHRWYAGLPALSYFAGGLCLVSALHQNGYRAFTFLFFVGAICVNLALAPAQAVVENGGAKLDHGSGGEVLLRAA
ncbi:spinster family MFS transporter [Novosphingobium aquimarinum]|uniref:spinster family MFS transporter n=1 Tax=Novosphingobium aquimarinum TaxID=2682494 RepID=UPI0012EC3993|nr:MFS transporter [Novosphingobium aquimarinum]